MKGFDNIKYCNRELLWLIKLFKDGNYEYLNILTGDVDNLGYLVAENGRAVAQNFVDYTINVIRLSIEEIMSSRILNPINNVYLPSGEEVSLFSIDNEFEVLDHINDSLSYKVNKNIKENSIVGFNNITISFASHTYRRSEIIGMVDHLFWVISQKDANEVAIEYFRLLSFLRKEVERAIDIEKFKNLLGNNKNNVVALRNYVFFKMIQYKKDVKKYLPKFNSVVNSYGAGQLEELTESFGISNKKSRIIKQMIEKNKGLE